MKKEYRKPGISKVNLKIEEAVLAVCKGAFALPLGPGRQVGCIISTEDPAPCNMMGS